MSVQAAIDRIVGEVTTQADLITQITTALAGKTAGTGGSVETGTLTPSTTYAVITEPGVSTYYYDLSVIPDVESKKMIMLITGLNDSYPLFGTLFREDTSETFAFYDGGYIAYLVSSTAATNVVSFAEDYVLQFRTVSEASDLTYCAL